jgi:competence protein ComEC
MAAFGTGPLLLCSIGLVVLCLLKTPLRFAGALLIGVAIVLMIRAPQPDVLVAGDGSAFAVRGPDGRLAVLKSGGDVFAVREWLSADADARSSKDHTLDDGIRCDDAGCVVRLRDGSLVAIAKTIEAFEEDCRRAVLVVSAGDAPPGCVALVVDRRVWRRSGAVALRRVGEGFEIVSTRPAGYERPWTRAAPVGDSPDAGRPRPPQTRDATPSKDDLEAGD